MRWGAQHPFEHQQRRFIYRWASWVGITLLGLSLVVSSSLTMHASAAEAQPTKERAIPAWIPSMVDQMSLEEKVGQMFMMDIYGQT
ncbi:MAG: hypothetical protein IMW91_11125, partial [Firmicutes bacterium]|nr:hypothetical protein [Bacillota bacterium]